MRKGLLIVISGPAGSGKGTVIGRLLKDPAFAYSVSVTTRAPRPGEQNGVNYWFMSRAEYDEKKRNGELLESAEYCGNGYGTPRRQAEEVLASGRNLILEIEVAGAMQIKRTFPEAVLIMLLPPSFAEQEKRLRGRGTETDEVICNRLKRTREELEFLSKYDYIVYNRDGEEDACVADLLAIVRAEQCAERRDPNAGAKYFAN